MTKETIMCHFENQEIKDQVINIISEKVSKRERFTGFNVVESLRGSEVGLYIPPAWQISSYVRELFNGHSSAFEGYACYPVGEGPLLFFPIPHYVRNHAQKIQEAIEGAKSQEG
jgi:hypothetical protein